MNETPETARYEITIDYWPDEGREPTADEVFLAVQDAVGRGGRLHGVAAECIDVKAVA